MINPEKPSKLSAKGQIQKFRKCGIPEHDRKSCKNNSHDPSNVPNNGEVTIIYFLCRLINNIIMLLLLKTNSKQVQLRLSISNLIFLLKLAYAIACVFVSLFKIIFSSKITRPRNKLLILSHKRP